MSHASNDESPQNQPDKAPLLTLAGEKISRAVDKLLGFVNSYDPDVTEEKQSAPDWSEEMPVTPNDEHVNLLLQNTLLVLIETDPDVCHMDLSCHPTSGYTPDGEIATKTSFPLEIDLSNTPDIFPDYAALIESWALTETGVVIFSTPTSPLLIVNPENPEEWVPVPEVDPTD